MPRILIAEEAGACYGVRRALDMVLSAAEEATGEVHTLGPLIHNPQVVDQLAERGVTVVEDPCQPAGSTLLMRTHGVTPEVERAARESGVNVLDATCPYVKKAHLAAERLEREGYQVIIVGEKGHPEVEGTQGHAPSAVVVGSAEELDGLRVQRRVGVVVQTTQTQACLTSVVGELLARAEEVRVVNTICEATTVRQRAAARLAGQAQVMVVIGGRNSANTTHLAEICAERCPQTHHIETAEELDPAWFDGADLIGITAGASTPQDQIERVRAAIAALVGEGDAAVRGRPGQDRDGIGQEPLARDGRD